jgi:Family of unknown function (DUF6194)
VQIDSVGIGDEVVPRNVKSAANYYHPTVRHVKDYTGFDEASKLNRGELFRLNVDLGKERFEELFEYLPAEHQSQHDRYDYTALNIIFPHPIYASYGWASIINPSGDTEVQVKEILLAAHKRALRKMGN